MSSQYCDNCPDHMACAVNGCMGAPDPEAEAVAQADAQALADVRTLDEWAMSGRSWTNAQREVVGASDGEHGCVLHDGETPRLFHADTPEAARAKAAAWVREQAKETT